MVSNRRVLFLYKLEINRIERIYRFKRGTEIPLIRTGSGKPSRLNRTQSHATDRDVEITMPILILKKIYQISSLEDRTYTFVQQICSSPL